MRRGGGGPGVGGWVWGGGGPGGDGGLGVVEVQGWVGRGIGVVGMVGV